MSLVGYPIRHEELGKFLVSRRTRLSPESCGLPSTRSRRRTPGLRREDVSSIAGISTAYYTWIEQGRPFDISTDVLYAIAGALHLTDIETAYVFVLAGKAEQRARSAETELTCEEVMQVAGRFEGGPALALTPWLHVLGLNAPARDLFGFELGTNLAQWFFCMKHPQLKICNCTDVGVALVALLRRNRARANDSGPFEEVIEHLRAESRDFARMWEEYVVDSSPLIDIEFERSDYGRVAYRTVLLCDSLVGSCFILFMAPIASRPAATLLTSMP
jgi:transcriptional regulator with XRE-family HTH domain